MPTGFNRSGNSGNSSGGSSFGGTGHGTFTFMSEGRIKGKPGVLWLFFFIGALFASLCLGSLTISQSSFVKTRESDYEYYKNLATTGQIVTGYVEEYAQGGENKWYFTYRFKIDDGSYVCGYSFSVYSRTTLLQNYPINHSFQLAVEQGIITSNSPSIPVDYANTTLQDDGDYLAAQQSVKVLLLVTCVVGALSLFCLIMGIVKISKYVNSTKEEKSIQTIVDKTETKQEEKEEELKVCEYCGTYIPPKTTKCPNCGASQKK